MDLEPDTLVTDNVRLVEVLGRGGMGSVWIADHLALGTRVAVKFLSAELVKKDPAMRERFNREAALGAKIKSPHVVQTFDHGVMEDGRPYIVMELLEGENLAQRLERERMLSSAHTRQVVAQTARALSAAHKLDIVHRDIKPDNLFLVHDDDEEIFVKVLDFGIAKQTGLPKASSVTGTGTMVGTPEYMSPEQVLSARSVDHRSDLWALGVVCYHCLTGGVPFTGETLGSLCVAIAQGKFTPVSKYRPDLPEAVDTWFSRALAVEPSERFASAKEMAASFARVLSTGESLLQAVADPDWSGARAALGSIPDDAVAHALTTPDAPSALSKRSDAPPPNAPQLGPTFAGATVSHRAASGTRRLAALGGALVIAGAAAAGFWVLRSTAEAPPPAESARDEGAASDRSPSVAADPVVSPTASSAPAAAPASASASASASAASSVPPSPPVRRAPPARPPPPALPPPPPPPMSKDRGF